MPDYPPHRMLVTVETLARATNVAMPDAMTTTKAVEPVAPSRHVQPTANASMVAELKSNVDSVPGVKTPSASKNAVAAMMKRITAVKGVVVLRRVRRTTTALRAVAQQKIAVNALGATTLGALKNAAMVVTTRRSTTVAKPVAVLRRARPTENASMAEAPRNNADSARAGNKPNALRNAAAVTTSMIRAAAATTTTTNAPLAVSERRERKPNVVSTRAGIRTAVAKKLGTT